MYLCDSDQSHEVHIVNPRGEDGQVFQSKDNSKMGSESDVELGGHVCHETSHRRLYDYVSDSEREDYHQERGEAEQIHHQVDEAAD